LLDSLLQEIPASIAVIMSIINSSRVLLRSAAAVGRDSRRLFSSSLVRRKALENWKRPSIEELGVPTESWQTVFAKNQTRYNLHLLAGVGFCGATLLVAYNTVPTNNTPDFVHKTGFVTTLPKDEELLPEAALEPAPAGTDTVDEVAVEEPAAVIEEPATLVEEPVKVVEVVEASPAETFTIVEEAVEEAVKVVEKVEEVVKETLDVVKETIEKVDEVVEEVKKIEDGAKAIIEEGKEIAADSTKLAEDVTEVVEEAVEIIGEVKEVIAEAAGTVPSEEKTTPDEPAAAE